jgi:hypothetical protein
VYGGRACCYACTLGLRPKNLKGLPPLAKRACGTSCSCSAQGNRQTPTLTMPEQVRKTAFSTENMFPAWYQGFAGFARGAVVPDWTIAQSPRGPTESLAAPIDRLLWHDWPRLGVRWPAYGPSTYEQSDKGDVGAATYGRILALERRSPTASSKRDMFTW